MVTITPSLMFSGTCGDAFRRYASLFGGEIVYMLTYGQSPAKSQVSDDWHEKVWFARLRAGDSTSPEAIWSRPKSQAGFRWSSA